MRLAMGKILRLYNTFTRNLNQVELNGKLVTSIGGGGTDLLRNPQTRENNWVVDSQRHHMLTGSFYICGPTVYSDSHLGHALTYIRGDLFRRFLKSYFNVHLTTIMNITDIDDKILAKCQHMKVDDNEGIHSSQPFNYLNKNPTDHPFRQISHKYYQSFINDLDLMRCQPAHLYVKVSENIDLIVKFIARLEKLGHAYMDSDSGDMLFNVSSVKNYQGRLDKRSHPNEIDSEHHDEHQTPASVPKSDQRDFVLWKAAKPLEPVWNYRSDITGRIIPGRPGWHVQCSAIASSLFGSQLDFHLGGKDLIFPHHYNEEACCCAFHGLDTSNSLHVWCNNWLHSSHLKLRSNRFNKTDKISSSEVIDPISGPIEDQDDDVQKMSKSLGNVISVNDFINSTSVNVLRLLCIQNHYRTDIEYSEDIIVKLKNLEHKLNSLNGFISDAIHRISKTSLNICSSDELTKTSLVELINEHSHSVDGDEDEDEDYKNGDIQLRILRTQDEIIDSLCDDFDISRNLDSILNLAKVLYSTGSDNIKFIDLIVCRSLLGDWYEACGLDFSQYQHSSVKSNNLEQPLYHMIKDFRDKVRNLALEEKRFNSKSDGSKSETANLLLQECDKVRGLLQQIGYVERDPASSVKNK